MARAPPAPRGAAPPPHPTLQSKRPHHPRRTRPHGQPYRMPRDTYNAAGSNSKPTPTGLTDGVRQAMDTARRRESDRTTLGLPAPSAEDCPRQVRKRENQPPTFCAAARFPAPGGGAPAPGARVRRLRSAAGLRRPGSGIPRTGAGATRAAGPIPAPRSAPIGRRCASAHSRRTRAASPPLPRPPAPRGAVLLFRAAWRRRAR
jgi:hypothetical protein